MQYRFENAYDSNTARLQVLVQRKKKISTQKNTRSIKALPTLLLGTILAVKKALV